MEFYLMKTIRGHTFAETIDRVSDELMKKEFGIITEIDVTSILKEKIGVEFRNYRILGACNPTFAHKALMANDKIGVLLPCNVCIQELPSGEIEISTINPLEAMRSVATPEIEIFAKLVADRLQAVLEAL